MLLATVSTFQVWFWANRIGQPSDGDCTVFGFAFIRVRLDNYAFGIFNIVLYALLLLTCMFILSISVCVLMNWMEEDMGDRPSCDSSYKIHFELFQDN
jgi:hypothetical protein